MQQNSSLTSTKQKIRSKIKYSFRYGVFYDNGILINKDRPLNPKVSYNIRKEMKQREDESERKRMKNTRRSQSESFYRNTNGNNTVRGGNNSDQEGDADNTSNYTKNTFLTTKDANIYRSEDFIESYLNHKITEITKGFDLRETVN